MTEKDKKEIEVEIENLKNQNSRTQVPKQQAEIQKKAAIFCKMVHYFLAGFSWSRWIGIPEHVISITINFHVSIWENTTYFTRQI